MSAQPGDRTPGESGRTTETVGAGAVAIDATGATRLGTVAGTDLTVEEVRVTATAADTDFNVEVDDTDVFSSEQSPSGTSEETYHPDQNHRVGGEAASDIEVDVSSASGTGGATAEFAVVVSYTPTW
jgi:hypothetical protein